MAELADGWQLTEELTDGRVGNRQDNGGMNKSESMSKKK